jgi:hypothetical protein
MLDRIDQNSHGRLAFHTLSWVMFARDPLTMSELQVALYETQKKSSKLGTAPNTMLSNDCFDNEDVILSCCAGLVRKKVSSVPSALKLSPDAPLDSVLKVNFFRMSFSSQKPDPQYTDHYLWRCPQIVQLRNTSSAFMATERDSYERTIWPSHVSDTDVALTHHG